MLENNISLIYIMMHEEVLKLYKDNATLTIVIGSLASGKTHYVLKILMPSIYTNYKRIYFFSTSNDIQKGDAYKNLKQYGIKILPAFDIDLINALVEYKKKHNKEQWLIIIDDATSLDDILRSQNKLIKFLFSNLRHLGIALIFIVHGSKAIITPLIRSICSHLILCKTPNMKLLEAIYEEFIAMHIDRKKFIQLYREKVVNKQYCNIQFINTSNKIFYYCPDVVKNT